MLILEILNPTQWKKLIMMTGYSHDVSCPSYTICNYQKGEQTNSGTEDYLYTKTDHKDADQHQHMTDFKMTVKGSASDSRTWSALTAAPTHGSLRPSLAPLELPLKALPPDQQGGVGFFGTKAYSFPRLPASS